MNPMEQFVDVSEDVPWEEELSAAAYALVDASEALDVFESMGDAVTVGVVVDEALGMGEGIEGPVVSSALGLDEPYNPSWSDGAFAGVKFGVYGEESLSISESVSSGLRYDVDVSEAWSISQTLKQRTITPPVIRSGLLGGPGTIYVGSRVRMSCRVTDSEGQPYDPSTMTMLFVTPPTSAPVKKTYTWPPTATGKIIRRAAGVFYVEWQVLLPGKYSFAWQSTSPGEEQYDEASFTAVARTIVF